MRRKKHKHTRRSVAFYKINHGFREPFKVLLDGNFIHATLEANLPHLQELLTRLLGGDVKLFVTPCVSKELAALGRDFAAASAAARALQLHKCGHAAALAPCDCLLEAVAGGNPGHWWVATQDRALQASLAALPGAPLLFCSVNGLHLADPPAGARASIAADTAAAQVLPAHERRSEALADLEELRPRDESIKAFRRKRAKGPNPLAVKKKRPAAAAAAAPPKQHAAQRAAAAGEPGGVQSQAAAADAAALDAKKRKRRRKQAVAPGSE